MSVNILDAIREFYLLEELHTEVEELPFSIRGEALRKDVKDMRESFHKALSTTFKDYLNLIIIGEGRYGLSKATPSFSMKIGREILFFSPLQRHMAYGIIQTKASQIDPKTALFQLLPAYLTRKWHSDYGGPRWAEITKVALLQFDTPMEIFIDTVINLEHNTSTVLNKSNPFFSLRECVKETLDFRARTRGPLYERWKELPLSYQTRALYRRAEALGVACALSETDEGETFCEYKWHPPITWGSDFIMLVDKKGRKR